MLDVPLHRLDQDLPIPEYANPGDAAIDLMARSDCVLFSGMRALVDTGIAIALPAGYAGLILPRSGLAWKHGVTVLNSPGLIDSGYRGELKVLLWNADASNDFVVERGMRIAQLMIVCCSEANLIEQDVLLDSTRGSGGFGSTGMS